MSRMSTFQCDGPACLEILDGEDEDDATAAGWLVVTFVGDEEEDRVAHLHSYPCLLSWTQEVIDQ